MSRVLFDRLVVALLGAGIVGVAMHGVAAQEASGAPPGGTQRMPNEKVGGSANMHLVAHVPLGGRFAWPTRIWSRSCRGRTPTSRRRGTGRASRSSTSTT